MPNLIKGVDYSRYQPHVNEAILAKGIDFAFIKATDGMGRDPNFIQHWTEAREAGIKVGCYHFCRPGDGKAQAKNFLDRFAFVRGSDEFLSAENPDGILPSTIDAEWSPNKATKDPDTWRHVSVVDRLKTITDFILTVETMLPVPVIIYTGNSWWKPMMGGKAEFNGVRFAERHLWLADYDGNPLPIPAPWKTYSIWQTSGHGHVAGVKEEIDLDVLRPDLTLADLCKRATGSVAVPNPPAVAITRTLKLGATGPDVKALQTALGIPASGTFDTGVENAVKTFQMAHKLTVDGQVGPMTRAALKI